MLDVENKLSEEQLGEIRSSFHKFSYGMFIVTTAEGGVLNGQTANSPIQITSRPNMFIVCINKNNYTYELLEKSEVVGLNVMGRDAMKLLGHFGFSSGRTVNKFENVQYELGSNGCPLLKEDALAVLEGKLVDKIDAGSHYACAFLVTDGHVNQAKKDIKPMTYEDFRILKKGGTLEDSALSIKESVEKRVDGKEGIKMGKYVCDVCGFIYDPAEEGMSFADQPDDYVCPVCGVGKDQFSPEA